MLLKKEPEAERIKMLKTVASPLTDVEEAVIMIKRPNLKGYTFLIFININKLQYFA